MSYGMSHEQFIETIRKAGAMMTVEQISKIGEEAAAKFGIDKDALMLLLLSGKQEFKDLVFDKVSNILNNNRGGVKDEEEMVSKLHSRILWRGISTGTDDDRV